ncbi:LuxR C-terminal-related transcriptional regulator [Sphingomonas sp.]|uniref:LuxR C-terminal-related transcriptional regulator n=1 Tax=Sphingomonas sp. TaxID=28214 RepID=UPI00286C0FAC|nr:LuxR C-terminal-related transcriptional regulator [Sphingomonas sp.]
MAGEFDDQGLAETIAASPIASVITNPRHADNPIEVANPAFCALTGYSESEILGRNCRFLAGASTEPWLTEQIRSAIHARRPVLVDILNYRSDGTPFRNGVMVTPLFGVDGELDWFLGSQVDLGEHPSELFSSRRSRAAALVKTLPARQREVLELVAKGLLNKQIAHRLGIAEKTVKMHRALLIERLGVTTTGEAIRIAVEAGL